MVPLVSYLYDSIKVQDTARETFVGDNPFMPFIGSAPTNNSDKIEKKKWLC